MTFRTCSSCARTTGRLTSGSSGGYDASGGKTMSGKKAAGGKNIRMVYTTDATRSRLIAAAMRLFLERGLFETQMMDVAEAVGISRSSLYRYYKDKVDLATAVLERVLLDVASRTEEMLGRAPAEATGIEKVRLYLEANFAAPSLAKQYRFLAEYDYFFSGARIPADFRKKVLRATRGRAGEELECYIRAGQLDGSIRKGLDPHLAMVTSYNALRGLQQRVILRGKALVELKGRERGAMTDEMIRYILEALRPLPPRPSAARGTRG